MTLTLFENDNVGITDFCYLDNITMPCLLRGGCNLYATQHLTW